MNAINSEAAVFFRFLGTLLQNEPSSTSMDTLKREGLFEALPYAQTHELVQKGQLEISQWLNSDADHVMDARCDYMRLFAGIGNSAVRPWGSFYMSNERLSFQAQTLKIREVYKRHGLELVLKNQEPDDHIGYELEFLAYLTEQDKMAEALDFINVYMNPWLFKWLASVEKYSSTGYYQGLAKIVAGGVEYFQNDY